MDTRKHGGFGFGKLFSKTVIKRGVIFGMLILFGLMCFEIVNYATTRYAFADILGDMAFAGIQLSSFLAFAFCVIDLGGIARIFTPETGADEPAEVWYLFGAWLLAAAFNSSLTWWAIKVRLMSHTTQMFAPGSSMAVAVPVVVAAAILVIRVLLINTFSIAGERLFSYDQEDSKSKPAQTYRPSERLSQTNPTSSFRPAPRPTPTAVPRPPYQEPTYHPVGMEPRKRDD